MIAGVVVDVATDPETPLAVVTETEVTVPAVDDVPAPMAVRKVAASRVDTLLSALIRIKVIADGFVSVNTLDPTVVAPKEVLPVAASSPVEPPSHFRRSVNALSQLVWEAVVGIEYPAVNVISKLPELVIGEFATLRPVGTVKPTEVTVPVFPLGIA